MLFYGITRVGVRFTTSTTRVGVAIYMCPVIQMEITKVLEV